MIDDSSRYAEVGMTEMSVTAADGTTKTVSYLKRRLLPPLSAQEVVGEYVVREDDRLDTIAARYLNDSTLFHRLCDANVQSSPTVLMAAPGDKMRLAQPSPGSGGAKRAT